MENNVTLQLEGSPICFIRIPHYAKISGKFYCLVGIDFNKSIAEYACDSFFVRATITSPTFQVDVVEVSFEEYEKGGGKKECRLITPYDRFVKAPTQISLHLERNLHKPSKVEERNAFYALIDKLVKKVLYYKDL